MNVTKDNLKKIMLAYVELEDGIVNQSHINEAYQLLPNKTSFNTPRSRILGINTFVIMNYKEIQEDLTKSDIEVSPDTLNPTSVIPDDIKPVDIKTQRQLNMAKAREKKRLKQLLK